MVLAADPTLGGRTLMAAASRELSREWAALSEEDKQPYRDLEAQVKKYNEYNCFTVRFNGNCRCACFQ